MTWMLEFLLLQGFEVPKTVGHETGADKNFNSSLLGS
jgi:hypothetical protein